jgi:hypothetical protein
VNKPLRDEQRFTEKEPSGYSGISGDISSHQYGCAGYEYEKETQKEEYLNSSCI